MEKYKKLKKNAEKNLRTGIEIWEEFSGFSHSKPRSISSVLFFQKKWQKSDNVGW